MGPRSATIPCFCNTPILSLLRRRWPGRRWSMRRLGAQQPYSTAPRFRDLGITGQSEPDFFDWLLATEDGAKLVMRIERQARVYNHTSSRLRQRWLRAPATTETDIPAKGVLVFSFSAPVPVHSSILPSSPRSVTWSSPRFSPGISTIPSISPRIAAAAASRSSGLLRAFARRATLRR